jgi:hypothetical protein
VPVELFGCTTVSRELRDLLELENLRHIKHVVGKDMAEV